MQRVVVRTIIFVIILFSFISVNAISAFAQEKDVTILFTHDLHDNFYPYTLERDGSLESAGGFAKLYSAIEKEREIDPNAILVDGGDYAMGTLFQTIFASHAPTLRLMGKMGYDATTFGNHEFDFRAEGLANHLQAAIESKEVVPDIVAANISYPKNEDGTMEPEIAKLKEAMEAYGVTQYKIIERNGLKIGIFGLMGREADSMAPMSGVEFPDMIESAQKTVAHLKEEEEVDLIIALSHSGTWEDKKKSEDEILAKEVPDIDFIVSGHTHTTLEEPIVVNDTVIGSTGEYGQNLGVIKLKQNERGRWDVSEYRLEKINEQVKDHDELLTMIDEFKQIVQAEYLDHFAMEFDQVLAYSPFNFTSLSLLGKEHREEAIGNLIGDAFIHTIKENEGENYKEITAAVVPVGTIRSSFFAGDITVSDVFNVSSLGVGKDQISGYPLIEVYLTGKELKTAAEVDASIAPIMETAQLYISGLSYTFNPNRLIFNKVTDVHIQKEDGSLESLNDDQLYRLVTGLYTAQMLPVVGEKSFNLLSIVPKKADGTPITNFEDHILYASDDEEREIKEWYALASYLMSFDKVNGVAQIPDKYAEGNLDRKIVVQSKNIIDIVKKPNGIALTIYAVVIVLITGVVLFVRFIYRRRKRKVAQHHLEKEAK